jgi:hypothetical protein
MNPASTVCFVALAYAFLLATLAPLASALEVYLLLVPCAFVAVQAACLVLAKRVSPRQQREVLLLFSWVVVLAALNATAEVLQAHGSSALLVLTPSLVTSSMATIAMLLAPLLGMRHPLFAEYTLLSLVAVYSGGFVTNALVCHAPLWAVQCLFMPAVVVLVYGSLAHATTPPWTSYCTAVFLLSALGVYAAALALVRTEDAHWLKLSLVLCMLAVIVTEMVQPARQTQKELEAKDLNGADCVIVCV